MKLSGLLLTAIVFISSLSFTDDAIAQLRDSRHSPMDWTGNVVNEPASTNESSNKLFGLVNFHMGHSYEMTMTNMGNQTFNQNFYTNTLHLLFNERLTGRLDVSVGHSLFGNMPGGFDNSPQVFIRNAELNYKFSENTRVHVSFSHMPAGYGYNNMFNPYSPYNRNSRLYNPYGF